MYLLKNHTVPQKDLFETERTGSWSISVKLI